MKEEREKESLSRGIGEQIGGCHWGVPGMRAMQAARRRTRRVEDFVEGKVLRLAALELAHLDHLVLNELQVLSRGIGSFLALARVHRPEAADDADVAV